MGNTQGTETLREGDFMKSIEFIASDFILTQNFTDMLSLTNKEYCDKLLILTTKVISKYLSGLEIEHLVQKHINGNFTEENEKTKVLYLQKRNLSDLDNLDPKAKASMCEGLAKFYIKIAHVFASITASVNPTYTYKTRAGKKLTFNLLNRAKLDKYNIPHSEQPDIQYVSFCGRRIDCLSSGLNIKSVTDPKQKFTIQPGFCMVNKNSDGTVRDLFDEPGMAEIKQLYYDTLDDNNKYTKMSEQAEKDYKERLVKFWELLSDKTPPDDLKYMSQITLRQFHNERGCHVTAETGKQGFQKSHYRKSYEGTLEDKLFKDYVDNIKDIIQTSLSDEVKLMSYLNELFETTPDPSTGKHEVSIKSDLTDVTLDKLIATLRNDQMNMYIECEEKFLKGFKIFEQIVSSRVMLTAEGITNSLSEEQDKIFEAHPGVKEIYKTMHDKPKETFKEHQVDHNDTLHALTGMDDDVAGRKLKDLLHNTSHEDLNEIETKLAKHEQDGELESILKKLKNEQQKHKQLNKQSADLEREKVLSKQSEMTKNINHKLMGVTNQTSGSDTTESESERDTESELETETESESETETESESETELNTRDLPTKSSGPHTYGSSIESVAVED